MEQLKTHFVKRDIFQLAEKQKGVLDVDELHIQISCLILNIQTCISLQKGQSLENDLKGEEHISDCLAYFATQIKSSIHTDQIQYG